MNLELPEQPLQAQENRTGDLRALINADAAELSARLNRQRLRDFPPSAQKSMRRFSPQETSRLLGIHDGYLRQLVTELKGPQEQGARRSYTLEDISSLRSELHRNGKEAKRYLPHRKTGEPLQILSVMNFKGGSGKTTTTVAIGFLQLTLILRPHSLRYLVIRLSLMWVKMRPSTEQFDMAPKRGLSPKLCEARTFPIFT
jgi:hypothetical protein